MGHDGKKRPRFGPASPPSASAARRPGVEHINSIRDAKKKAQIFSYYYYSKFLLRGEWKR